MAKVLFNEELHHVVGGASYTEVEATTVQELLCGLFNQYPQLYVHINTLEYATYAVVMDDEEILEAVDLTRTVDINTTIELVSVVPLGHDAGMIGAAVINFVAGAGTVTATSLGAIIVGSIIISGVMIALNMIIGALMGDVEMPDIQSGSLDNSATYTFTGIKNTTAGGTPVQIVYGAHRTGGHVLALFTTSGDTVSAAGTADTYLYYQLGMSEGEISGVSDVEINKLPYTFYQAVATAPDTNYIRVGSSNQTPMYEFNQITNTTSISRKVMYAGSIGSPVVSFSDYTPVLGYVSYDAWRPELKLGMYTSSLQWQDDYTGY